MAKTVEPENGQSTLTYEHVGPFVLGLRGATVVPYFADGALIYNPESNQYIAPLDIGINLIFDDRKKLVGWYNPNNEEKR